MKLTPTTGLFDPRATTTDPHRDGSRFQAGAWIWKQKYNGPDQEPGYYPITITYDNGTLYEYVLGHVDLNSSNNRSTLFLSRP
jgi:hypothetical protein